MKLSYAITVCTEVFEIQTLLSFLEENKRNQDEIVVLYDETNGDHIIKQNLKNNPTIKFHTGKFNGDFSKWKNKLVSLCSGNYIINLDADEIPHKNLIETLPFILESQDVDLIYIPRINTVRGITDKHIQEWGWRENEHKWLNYPDYQSRIFKNNPKIKWEGEVHETIKGFKTFAYLPKIEEYSLYHPKDIKKQEKQNEYYNTLNRQIKEIKNHQNTVSLIIPTNGTNENYTNALLDNIQELYGGDENLEVIVENNNKVTLGINYNNAVKKAKGDIIILLHNDMILKEGFIEKIKRDLKPNSVLSYTRIEPPTFPDIYPGKVILDAGYNLNDFDKEKFDNFKVEDKVIFGGSQLFFAVFKKDYIGIDGYTFTKFCEDDDIHLRYTKAGYTHYVSPASVYHFGSKTSRVGNYSKIELESRQKFINKWGKKLEKQNPTRILD